MRERPHVVSTRVKPDERALIRLVAEVEGISVSEALHRLAVPAARKRVMNLAAEEQREVIPAEPVPS